MQKLASRDANMCKRVLIITYSFPPRHSVASLRPMGLAKYLPEFGWQPVILTVHLPKALDTRFQVVRTPYPGDVSTLLIKKFRLNPEKGFQEQIGIPISIRGNMQSLPERIIRLIKEFFAYPDEQKAWLPHALKAGCNILRNDDFDAIISTSGPETTHLIAAELKNKYSLPWVADFRDLWSQNHYYPYRRVRKLLHKSLEIKTIALADALTTVSEPLAEKLRVLHNKKKIFSIPNGFDPDEMKKASPTKKFTITYTGQLYQGKQDPVPLLRAIKKMIVEKVVNSSSVRIHFFGPQEYWLDEEIKRYNLGNIVKQYGKVSREIALTKQRESQILLLLNWDDPEEGGVYTGKIFEYLAASRPILAVGGRSGDVVYYLLKETGAGVQASSVQVIADILKSWYLEYLTYGQVFYCGRHEQIIKYSHLEMAKKFAEVLNEVSI